MKLMTKEIEKTFAKIGRQEDSKNPKVIAKFFCPWGAATWWATEYDPKDKVFFGFAYLGDEDCAELGTFALAELEAVRGPFHLTIERDLGFKGGTTTLREALENHGLNRSAASFG
jgi:hypothetical protein